MRCSTERARSSRRRRISHRGLSGMKKITRKKSSAGSVSAPNIPRQSSVTQIVCIHCEA